MQVAKYTTLQGWRLWPWYSIDIEYDPTTNTKYVYFNTTIHVNKRVRLPVCFTNKFTDSQILSDHTLYTQISEGWGNVTV